MATTEKAPAPASTNNAPAPQGNDLVTNEGTTTIADGVVAKIAENAAREVRGVHELASGLGGALRRIAPGISDRGSAASVEVGQREAIVELDLVVDYGISIPQTTAAVRQNVISRLQQMTGLTVKEVNIEVSDLYFAEEERSREDERHQRESRIEASSGARVE